MKSNEEDKSVRKIQQELDFLKIHIRSFEQEVIRFFPVVNSHMSRIEQEIARLSLTEKPLEDNYDIKDRAISYIIELIGGTPMSAKTDKCDLKLDNGNRIKIKPATCNSTDKKKGGITKRWEWKDFGKEEHPYDYLILLGAVDEQFRSRYKEKDVPYILFEIPSSEIDEVLHDGNRITITFNYDTVDARIDCSSLNKYRKTRQQLAQQHGGNL